MMLHVTSVPFILISLSFVLKEKLDACTNHLCEYLCTAPFLQVSFQSFVCLMQISTRDRDFLIDTLELRSELAVLNDVFTDPKILKVLVHG